MTPHPSYQPILHDTEHSQSSGPQPTVQPPLRPTGFIQGQHGTLIPIYHPEALDQYMANSQHTQTPPTLTQSQNAVQSPSAWNSYTQNPIYPYPMPMPPMMTSFPQQRGWMPNAGPSFGFPAAQHPMMHHGPTPYGLPASSSGTMSSTVSSRHSYPAVHHGRRSTPPPKRFGRREHHFNSGLNPTYSRPIHTTHNRFGRINGEVRDS